MKKIKTKTITIFSILLCIVLTTGCIDLNEVFNGSNNDDDDDDNNTDITTYEKNPTKISYTISYGYILTVSGNGNYSIQYSCDEPEVLNQNGYATITKIYDNTYKDDTVATYNNIKKWEINKSTPGVYNLGIEAQVLSEVYMITDLNGTNSLTVDQIQNQHPELITQYIRTQSNNTVVFIDPFDSEIKSISSEVLKNSNTENAFKIAKNLFIWLKQNTKYERHTASEDAQTCTQTLNSLKGDCDDLSFLYISLLRSAGIPARFIRGFLINYNNGLASLEPHAWVEVFVGGGIGKNGWIPVECACSSNDMGLQVHQNFGVESASHLRVFKDDGSNKSINFSLTGVKIRYYQDINIQQSSLDQIENFQIVESKNLQIKNNIRTYEN